MSFYTNDLLQDLQEVENSQALSESDLLLLDTADAICDVLEEATALELTDYDEDLAGVDFSQDYEKYQFHNQDYLSGLSQKDIDSFHPDNYDDSHASPTATTGHTAIPSFDAPTLVEQLLEGKGADEYELMDTEGLGGELHDRHFDVHSNSAYMDDEYPLMFDDAEDLSDDEFI